jgi:hypothetical protein
VVPVAVAAGCCNRQHTLVDAACSVARSSIDGARRSLLTLQRFERLLMRRR